MTCTGRKDDPSERCTNEMPAFESRRVRTQPFTVTGASCGALPAKIQRTLKILSSIERELSWSSVKSQLSGSGPDSDVIIALTAERQAVSFARKWSEGITATCRRERPDEEPPLHSPGSLTPTSALGQKQTSR